MIDFIKKIFSDDPAEQEIVSAKRDESFTSADKIFEHFTLVTGMHFRKKEKITRDKIINFCRRKNIYSFEELHDEMLKTEKTMQELIDFLTVNETFFNREMDQVNVLCDLIKSCTQKTKILCAPCATGEEVYSIIIALLVSGIDKNLFEVTGIDINHTAIEFAKDGIFSKRSLNNLDDSEMSKYFFRNTSDSSYTVVESVKEQAKFYQKNIFDDSFKSFGKFDFIFSRNMFIYFDEKDKSAAIDTFCTLLNSGGYMFFGHADTFGNNKCLEQKFIGRTKIYQKTN